ncbi:hypothetical protein ACLOJK_013673, partial [Asimina triloba]
MDAPLPPLVENLSSPLCHFQTASFHVQFRSSSSPLASLQGKTMGSNGDFVDAGDQRRGLEEI